MEYGQEPVDEPFVGGCIAAWETDGAEVRGVRSGGGGGCGGVHVQIEVRWCGGQDSIGSGAFWRLPVC